MTPDDGTSAAPARDGPPAVPRATYRLQLNRSFTFDDAADLVPYLARLGISHVYASPFLTARAGSTHGYDITDHNRLNPEIGTADSFARLGDALAEQSMGLIADFVPNHMGVGGSDNPWWLDVLEWGQASPFAGFFDIDWSPAEPSLRGKVLVPFLGDHYGIVLESGQLRLAYDGDRGSFDMRYWEHRFPLALRDYPALLRAARERLAAPSDALGALIAEFAALRPNRRSVRQQAVVHRRADALKARLARLTAADVGILAAITEALAQVNGTPGDPPSLRGLHRLLERQSYRLAYWRVATAEINYRRFFDINDLAGLRMERDDLFEVAHQLVFRLIAEGRIHGLRLDHTDGLFDPEAYCRKLQDRAAYLVMQREIGATLPVARGPAARGAAVGGGLTLRERTHPFYLLVEKILARHERLRPDWPIDGTTGYEVMNLLNGLFVDPAAEQPMTQLYERVLGQPSDLEQVALAAKRQVVGTILASEFTVLASDLHELARQSWLTRDFTLPGVKEALVSVVSHFPVYRTYISDRGVTEEDRRDLDWAFARARREMVGRTGDPGVLNFLHAVLTTDLARERGSGYRRREVLKTAMKFQQFTGPVMAKAIEDTAFYRYYRLVSLNEVGGEPGRFGISVAAFHRLNQDRLRHHPYTLLATATHDHKRGEDTRVRIDAITEHAAEWSARVDRWMELNAAKRRQSGDEVWPTRNDEYLFYQVLVGAWPLGQGDADPAALAAYADRLVQYMIKAVREAKLVSSWTLPNADYEDAVEGFVRAVLDPARSASFLADVSRFEATIAAPGALNGLVQTALKMTVPGIPDLYQGTELWDLSLVDPDNRRPVDFAQRCETLAALEGPIYDADLARLLGQWRDGRLKTFILSRLLRLRREAPLVFTDGDYEPLEVVGAQGDRVVAFARVIDTTVLVVVVPRLVAGLIGDGDLPLVPATAWGDTAVVLPEAVTVGGALTDCLTASRHGVAERLRVADLLARLPVAVLISEPAGG